jgi:YidC/Oxa1 family membrane protein insertase
MDKKTIAGIVLIALILIFLPYYEKIYNGGDKGKTAISNSLKSDTSAVAQSDRTNAKPENISTVENKKNPDINEAKLAKSDKQFEPSARDSISLDTIPEKFVYAQTKRYDIVLTTNGATLVSIQSREFRGPDGIKPLELVPNETEGDPFPLIGYCGDTLVSTIGVNFVADIETLILDAKNPTGEITFVAMLPNNAVLQRKYKFNFEEYSFHHSAMFSGDSAQGLDEWTLWWKKGFQPSEPNFKSANLRDYNFGYYAGESYESKSFGKKEEPKFSREGSIDFVATHNKYFVAIVAPYEGVGTGVRAQAILFNSLKFGNGKIEIPAYAIGLAQTGGKAPLVRNDLIYIGPRDYNILKKYNRSFEKSVNLGWKFLVPLTIAFMWLFDFLHTFIANYGLILIVFSIIIKALLWPLSRSQTKSLKRMRDLEPKMAELREKYKSDVKKMNEETMKLYQKEKINPFSGCLWMLPQMPIFFSLYVLFSNAFALRGAPFVFWITDLAQKDPYYVLPVLMGVSMFVQQKLTTKDPKQKMMVWMMPILFVFLFRSMPSGLVLYWLMFNIFSLAQTLWIEYGPKKETRNA